MIWSIILWGQVILSMKKTEDFSPNALLGTLTNVPSYIQDFDHAYSQYGQDKLYCFVEGKDAPFYIIYCPDAEFIKCKGKKFVIDANKYMRRRHDKSLLKLRFFVDRDFDDNSLLHNSIYITDGYSIENFYVCKECVERILKSEFHLDGKSNADKFNKALNLFSHKLYEFNEGVLLFNSWYANVKRTDDVSGNPSKVNLDDKFPNKLTKYQISTGFEKAYTKNDIISLYPAAPHISDKDIESTKSIIFRDKLGFYLRGKYQLEFLYKFLTFLNDDATKNENPIYTLKGKNFHVSFKYLLSELSQYHERSYSLIGYVRDGVRV